MGFASQLMDVNTSHQHPKVVAAIKEQAKRLCYTYAGTAIQPCGDGGRNWLWEHLFSATQRLESQWEQKDLEEGGFGRMTPANLAISTRK